MTAIDYFKAAGLALLILALNMLLATLAIAVLGAAQGDPPSPEAIASWTAPIGGFVLFFIAIFRATRRKPDRPAFVFALVTFAFYLVLDVAIGYASAGAAVFQPLFAGSLALALLGAVLGARSGRGPS